MRKLMFRAWDKEQKKWLFGYELPNLGGFSLTGEVVLLGELGSIPLMDWNHIEIMQYTGLKDKNGKEIYEGDLVRTTYDEKGVGVIEFMDGGFWWMDVKKTDGELNFMPSENYREIIGNVYENPELTNPTGR